MNDKPEDKIDQHAYLLQRMESYPGAVILATNFRQNVADAFLVGSSWTPTFVALHSRRQTRVPQLVSRAVSMIALDN